MATQSCRNIKKCHVAENVKLEFPLFQHAWNTGDILKWDIDLINTENDFTQKCCHYLHLADDFIQSNLQCIQATHFYQYVCSLGIEPTTFYTVDTMLYHWATGTHVQPTAIYAPLCYSKSVWLYSGTQKKIYWRMLVTKPFQFPLTSTYLDNKYSTIQWESKQFGFTNSNTGLEQHEGE